MKKMVSILAFLLVVLVMVGCSSGSNPSSGSESGSNENNNSTETKVLKFALDLPPGDSWVKATNKFSELVAEKTDGSVKVEVYDSAALGAQREALEGMLVGTVDGTVSLEPVSYWVEDIGLFGIPYLFESKEHLQKFMEGELGSELENKIIDAGFRPLTYFERAPRQISSNVPINQVSDVKGLTIRVPETPTAPPAFEKMGAKPVTMPFSEVYSALQQGVIDAQENPVTLIVANQFYDVQDYVAITEHQRQVGYFLISEKKYQTLSEEEKQALTEAAEEMQTFERDILQEDIETALQSLEEEGVKITKPDQSEFAEAATEAYDGYDDLMKEWIEKIKSIK